MHGVQNTFGPAGLGAWLGESGSAVERHVPLCLATKSQVETLAKTVALFPRYVEMPTDR